METSEGQVTIDAISVSVSVSLHVTVDFLLLYLIYASNLWVTKTCHNVTEFFSWNGSYSLKCLIFIL